MTRNAGLMHVGQLLGNPKVGSHHSVDGRNRYLACQEIGVEPAVKEWNGEGTPESYVISKNLQRRHLNESQRAMIASKLANIERGEVGRRHEKTDGSIDLSVAASMLNVSVPSVKRARVVRNKGTLEEIAVVENGEAANGTGSCTARDLRVLYKRVPHFRRLM